MIKEKTKTYYLDGDYNCAEAIILGAKEVLGLDLPADSFKLFSAFGGGMGCGKTCGAISAATAIYGFTKVKERAHEREDFKEEMAEFVTKLEGLFGSINCDDIHPVMVQEECRCLATVEKVCDALDEVLANNK